MGDHSAETFKPLWDEVVSKWNCYFYVTDGWPVYPMFIPEGDQIVSRLVRCLVVFLFGGNPRIKTLLNRRETRRARIRKTYMTRVKGENTRLRHYLARLKRKILCYSKSKEMLKHSIRLLLHYLKFGDLPIPYSLNYCDRQTSTSLDRFPMIFYPFPLSACFCATCVRLSDPNLS